MKSMGKKMDAKSVILIVVIVVLIAAGGYLVFLIQDGSNPLVLLNSQASEDDPLLDVPEDEDPLLAQAGSSPTPSPTIPFRSTSPTVTPTGAALSATPTIDLLASPTVLPTELPETGGGVVTATPTPVQNLPVAGVFDYLPAVAGGALLIIVAMLL